MNTFWIIFDLHRPYRMSYVPQPYHRYQIHRIQGRHDSLEQTVINASAFVNATPIPGRWESEDAAVKECNLLEAISQVMDS